MNIKDYISSGILEAYVLGELSATEKSEVDKNADEYPEVYKEIRQIKEAFHVISVESQKQAGIHPEVKPLSKKTKIKSINKKKSKKLVENLLNNKIKVSNYLATAAIVLAIVSSFAAADLYLKLKNTQDHINALHVEGQLKNYFISEDDYAGDQNIESYSFLFTPSFVRLELYDIFNNNKFHCWIFYNKGSQELFMQVNHLPRPKIGEQYQLWALIDEIPVSAGLIPNEISEDIFRMKRTKNASAFMVTIEPEGGSNIPNYEREIAFRRLEDL